MTNDVCRSKNTVNILTKNMLDTLIGGLVYWAFGWAFAYGANGNEFIGGSGFLSIGLSKSKFPMLFFEFVFAATAATIVSGSISERCQIGAYIAYSVITTGKTRQTLVAVPIALVRRFILIPILFFLLARV